jgi:hypothetical protein
MKNTAIFMADTWAKTQDVIYKALSMPPKDGMEYLISNYPQIQGMRNQMRLRQLAALAFNSSEIEREIIDNLPTGTTACLPNVSDHRADAQGEPK